MTATEELRRLLDERGVEHFDGTESTLWGYEQNGAMRGVYRYSADETSGGYMQVSMLHVTPEQAIAATLGNNFQWHLMSDEWPEKGKDDYIIIGIKGGLYLAPRFEGYGDTEDTAWFRDTRGKHHHPSQVLAWAEIPPLEVC